MAVYLDERIGGASPSPGNTSACPRCQLVRLDLSEVGSEDATLRSILSNPKYQALVGEYEENLRDLRDTLDGRGDWHDTLEIAALLRSTADRFEVAHDPVDKADHED